MKSVKIETRDDSFREDHTRKLELSPAPSPTTTKRSDPTPDNLARAREVIEEKITAKKREKSEELLQPVIVNHSSTSLSAASSEFTNKSDTDTSSSHYMSVNSSKHHNSETDK
eukprot:sb/3476955/